MCGCILPWSVYRKDLYILWLMHVSQEFYSGGDLLTHLTRGDAFGPERARFYASEIVRVSFFDDSVHC